MVIDRVQLGLRTNIMVLCSNLFSTSLIIITTIIPAYVYTAEVSVPITDPIQLFSIVYQPKNIYKKPESFTIPLTEAHTIDLFRIKIATIIGNNADHLSWTDPEYNYDNFIQLKAFFTFLSTRQISSQETIIVARMLAKNRFDQQPKSFSNRLSYFYCGNPLPSIEHRISLLQQHYIDAVQAKNKRLTRLYGMALYGINSDLTHLYKPIESYMQRIVNQSLSKKETIYPELQTLEKMMLNPYLFFGLQDIQPIDTLPHSKTITSLTEPYIYHNMVTAYNDKKEWRHSLHKLMPSLIDQFIAENGRYRGYFIKSLYRYCFDATHNHYWKKALELCSDTESDKKNILNRYLSKNIYYRIFFYLHSPQCNHKRVLHNIYYSFHTAGKVTRNIFSLDLLTNEEADVLVQQTPQDTLLKIESIQQVKYPLLRLLRHNIIRCENISYDVCELLNCMNYTVSVRSKSILQSYPGATEIVIDIKDHNDTLRLRGICSIGNPRNDVSQEEWTIFNQKMAFFNNLSQPNDSLNTEKMWWMREHIKEYDALLSIYNAIIALQDGMIMSLNTAIATLENNKKSYLVKFICTSMYYTTSFIHFFYPIFSKYKQWLTRTLTSTQ